MRRALVIGLVGTGVFARLRGSGEMEVVYDRDDNSLGRETLSGTVTR